MVSKGPQFRAVSGQTSRTRGPISETHPCHAQKLCPSFDISELEIWKVRPSNLDKPKEDRRENSMVAGAIRRSSPAVGLWQTAWRAGERTQWQQVRTVASIDRVTQARHQKQAMRKAGPMKEGGEVMGGAEQTHQLLLPSEFVD